MIEGFKWRLGKLKKLSSVDHLASCNLLIFFVNPCIDKSFAQLTVWQQHTYFGMCYLEPSNASGDI